MCSLCFLCFCFVFLFFLSLLAFLWNDTVGVPAKQKQKSVSVALTLSLSRLTLLTSRLLSSSSSVVSLFSLPVAMNQNSAYLTSPLTPRKDTREAGKIARSIVKMTVTPRISRLSLCQCRCRIIPVSQSDMRPCALSAPFTFCGFGAAVALAIGWFHESRRSLESHLQAEVQRRDAEVSGGTEIFQTSQSEHFRNSLE